MSSGNRIVLILLPLLALIAAFWFLALAPKRERAAQLETDAAALKAELDQQEQVAIAATAARKDFPRTYRRLVVLGKAAPTEDDTSSLLVQLNRIASKANVDFQGLKATGDDDASSAATETVVPGEAPAETTEAVPGEAQPATTSPATEATAALLPIGSSIGPAGLPVMKYELQFEGDFFQLADFMDGVDDLVKTSSDGHVGVQGRLITIDAFELAPPGAEPPGPDPVLGAKLVITTFLTPPDEGATGGATPAGPAPATEAQPADTSAAIPESATASAETP